MSSMNSRQCHVSANPIDIFSIFERSNLRQNKLGSSLNFPGLRLSNRANYERALEILARHFVLLKWNCEYIHNT